MYEINKEIIEIAIERLHNQIGGEEMLIKDICSIPHNCIVDIRGIDFVCEVKGNITNANFNFTLKSLLNLKEKTDKPLLLIVKYIYPSLMSKLGKYDINVLDSVGNCLIKHDRLFLFIKGEKNAPTKGVTSRAFQDSGIKLIFHLLTHPRSENLPYRNLGQETGLSLGTIKIVMDELVNASFILTTNRGRFLTNKLKLLERWVEAYNEVLKPKLLLGRMAFRNREKREQWLTMTLPDGMYWGGESGANLIDDYLYPGAFDIYTDVPTSSLLKTGFVIPQGDGEIKIYQKFWPKKNENKIVPNLLIYADLMGSGNSRCLEMAQRILENGLADIK